MKHALNPREMWMEESEAEYLYRTLADLEQHPKMAELYRRLSATEARHAQVWYDRLIETGIQPEPYRPSFRVNTLIWIARHFGVHAVLPILDAAESKAVHSYKFDNGDMAAEERSHAAMLGHMQQISKGTGLQGDLVARLEGRHRSAGGNALRAAVLGASDGLLSNFNLVMGVAGAEMSTSNILLTGGAGLLAGAISMALGEWISVQSSRELYERQIAVEQAEIEASPQEEVEELALIYEARGLDTATALMVAESVMNNPDSAIDTLAREELGIDPNELGGSAMTAALTSFALFAVGALIPLIPYFFSEGQIATAFSALASGVGLFTTGALISFFTGRPMLRNGLRQTLFGLAAAAITYLIGKAVGIQLVS